MTTTGDSVIEAAIPQMGTAVDAVSGGKLRLRMVPNRIQTAMCG